MVYKRKGYKKNHHKKGTGKLAKLEKIVNRTKPTTKVYQTLVSGYVSDKGLSSVTGNAISVFEPANDTTFEARQNPVVHAKKIELCGWVSTSDSAQIVRARLYTGPDSQIPISNMQVNQGTTAAVNSPWTPSQLCNQRYQVLWDSGPMSIGVTGGLKSRISFKKTIDLKGMKVGFGNSTGQTIPDYHPLVFTMIGQDIDGVTTNTSHSTAFQTWFSS